MPLAREPGGQRPRGVGPRSEQGMRASRPIRVRIRTNSAEIGQSCAEIGAISGRGRPNLHQIRAELDQIWSKPAKHRRRRPNQRTTADSVFDRFRRQCRANVGQSLAETDQSSTEIDQSWAEAVQTWPTSPKFGPKVTGLIGLRFGREATRIRPEPRISAPSQKAPHRCSSKSGLCEAGQILGRRTSTMYSSRLVRIILAQGPLDIVPIYRIIRVNQRCSRTRTVPPSKMARIWSRRSGVCRIRPKSGRIRAMLSRLPGPN